MASRMGTGLLLFTQRMKREGRWDDFGRRKVICQAAGADEYQAMKESAAAMGYVNMDTELRIDRQFREDAVVAPPPVMRRKPGRPPKQPKPVEPAKPVDPPEPDGPTEVDEPDEPSTPAKRDQWSTRLESLPDQADPRRELDWVRGHPAMSRHARQSDKTKTVRLTAADLTCAPSKAAVISLCTWVDHPYEFQKQWLGEQKKKVEAAVDGVIEGDASLGEVERLLKEFRGE